MNIPKPLAIAAAAIAALVLGVLSVAALNASSNATDASEKASSAAVALAATQRVTCRRANVISGYLRKRAVTLTGSTANDAKVIVNGRPIIDCATQQPLASPEEHEYIVKLFACACEPQIRDGRVTGRGLPFR